PDVNILDADSAHFAQSKGEWAIIVGGTFATTPAGDSKFGPNVLTWTATTASQRPYIALPAGLDSIPIQPNTEYTLSIWVLPYMIAGTPEDSFLRIAWTNSSGIGTNPAFSDGDVTAHTEGEWVLMTVTGTSPSDAAFARPTHKSDVNGASGDEWRFSAAVLRAGSDATFIPSLRIVGDLDESLDAAANWPLHDGFSQFMGRGWATGDASTFWGFNSPSTSFYYERKNAVASLFVHGLSDGERAKVRILDIIATGTRSLFLDDVQ
ncbi:unnamed protein product, partial [marine sediment metagenome]